MGAGQRKRIGITLGDPAGIGPEVVRKALASGRLPSDCEYLVIGDESGFIPGQPSRASAEHAFASLEEAVRLAGAGEIDAVVTGPVCKKAMHEVGFDFPGQTEFFAERTGTENFAMCLTGGALTVALVTAHVPLAQVPSLLRQDEIARVGRLLGSFLRKRGIAAPRIAVAGLNPHAGEEGDLGREEIEIIQPALKILQQGASLESFSGPHSPDTLFHQVLQGHFDGVLCMYHDQGLIPLKFHAFDQGVNVTLGLPYPRTSPDHGTAFSLAGKGLASEVSTLEAIRIAVELCE